MTSTTSTISTVSTITGCVSFSAFASLVGIPIGITSSTIRLRICVITAWNNKHKLINKKNEKKHDKIVLLAKSKLNSMELLSSKTLIDSNISHDQFALINNVLITLHCMKKEIKNSNK